MTGWCSGDNLTEPQHSTNYFSVEPVDIENDENKEDQDVTGAAASSEVPADGTTKKTEPGENSSTHSRENEEAEKKEMNSQRSPLIEMKKTWNLKILMILMNKWMV